MDFADYLRTLYDASFWARDKIFAAADGLSEEEYAAPNGFVYGSLRGMLIHLLSAEAVWFARCRSVSPERPRIDETNYATLESLQERWAAEEQIERAYLDGLTTDDVEKEMVFSRANGETIRHPLWLILTQVYGHGIQHRAEAAEALTMAGRSPGNLDLLIYTAERGG